MASLNELDLKQEGRISTLEAKMDEALPLIKDLHGDLQARRARWHLVSASVKYVVWVIAGVVSFLGVSKSPALSEWLGQYPK